MKTEVKNVDYKMLYAAVGHNFDEGLRNLSDMTEKEKVFLFNLAFGEDHEYTSFGFDPIENIILADKDKRTRCAVSLNAMPVEGVRYLLSRGFDLFGLCDAGLAIDKTKLNSHGSKE